MSDAGQMAMSGEDRERVYSDEFYEASGEVARHAAVEIVPLLMASFGPSSVIDVGCGAGVFIEEFVRHDVTDVIGVEGSDFPADLYRGPDGSLRLLDLEQTLSLDRRFDLALCLEVAEHLSPARSAGFIHDLVELADVVVFSAAIPGQGGTHHVNEQWPSFWADQFSRQGFEAYDVLRPVIWTNPSIAWWYRQNLVVYARSGALPERFTPTTLMSLVHPDHYELVGTSIAELEKASSDLFPMWEEAERLRLLLAALPVPARGVASPVDSRPAVRGAQPFDEAWYLSVNPDVVDLGIEPRQHFATVGWREHRRPHPLFDTAWYLATNPDVAAAGIDPLEHYAASGWRERRNPHPLFDTGWYLDTHPDIEYTTGNPLAHFVESGWREGRDPHPRFHTSTYLAEHGDVAATGLDPLSHYVLDGVFEGRPPPPLRRSDR